MGFAKKPGTLSRRFSRIQHGAYATGTLPIRLAWLRPEIEGFKAGLVSDLGGDNEISTAQRGLIEQAGRTLTITLLLTWNVYTRGAVTRRGELRAPLGALATYENSLTRTLVHLGLNRGARRIDSYIDAAQRREAASRDVDEDSVSQTAAQEARESTNGSSVPTPSPSADNATADDEATRHPDDDEDRTAVPGEHEFGYEVDDEASAAAAKGRKR